MNQTVKATDNQKRAIDNFFSRNGGIWTTKHLKQTVISKERLVDYEKDPYYFVRNELTATEASNWLAVMIRNIESANESKLENYVAKQVSNALRKENKRLKES